MGRKVDYFGPVYKRARKDPKTRAAVEVLVEGGVPPAYAVPIVLVSLAGIDTRVIQDGSTGRVDHLDELEWAQECWPEAQLEGGPGLTPAELGALLKRALMAVPPGEKGGYVVVRGSRGGNRTVIAKFRTLFKRLIGDRARNYKEERALRAERARPGNDRASAGARRSTPTPKRVSSKAPSPTPPAAPSKPGLRLVEGAGASAARELGCGDPAVARAHQLILRAEANRQHQTPHADDRNRTLKPGLVYLEQLRDRAAHLAIPAEDFFGGLPMGPGMLLDHVAPEEAQKLAKSLAPRLKTVPERKQSAYVRTALARTWDVFLGKAGDQRDQDRATRRRQAESV